jgi:beta-xylosidase
VPASNDEFAGSLSLAWQFGSNPSADWMAVKDGQLRLKSVTGAQDHYENGAILSQKLPAFDFTVTTLMRFAPLRVGEKAGLTMHGMNFGWIGVEKAAEAMRVVQVAKISAVPDAPLTVTTGPRVPSGRLWLRLQARPVTIDVPPPAFSPYWPSMLKETHMTVTFSYSLDGTHFTPLGVPFQTRPGRWVGTQIGLFAQASSGTPSAVATTVGHADFDWFRISR